MKLKSYYIQKFEDETFYIFYMIKKQKNGRAYGVIIGNEKRSAKFHSILSPDLWKEIDWKDIPSIYLEIIGDKLNN